jgi:hypothetical protein
MRCSVWLVLGLAFAVQTARVDAIREGARQDQLSPEEQDAIRARLRARKDAIQRLALEDALGAEAKEQAKSEASAQEMLGGDAFLGAEEQKAKLTVSGGRALHRCDTHRGTAGLCGRRC